MANFLRLRDFICLIAVLCVMGGCAIPNLKPFAEATATLSTSVKTSGDLAIAPLAEKTVLLGTKKFLPGDANHPAKKLEDSWKLRKQAMEAMVAYSSSLAAIADASAHRKANATKVVTAVKELAAVIPGVKIGNDAVGDLLIMGISTIIEVKAYRDMGKAVQSAHPAIELIAGTIQKDFDGLAIQFESSMRSEIRDLKNEMTNPKEYYDSLIKERDKQRKALKSKLNPPTGAEAMIALDKLIAGVEPEMNFYEKRRDTLATRMKIGLKFFKEAKTAIDVWLKAHADLKEAFEEKRRPNLILLASRAQELKDLVDRLKSSK